MVAKARRHAARFACVLGTGTFLRMKVPSAGGSAKRIAGDKGVRREAGSEGSPRQIHGQPLIAQGKQFTLSPGGGQRPPSGDKSCSGTMLAEVKRSWNKKLVAQRRAALCRERRLTEFLPISWSQGGCDARSAGRIRLSDSPSASLTSERIHRSFPCPGNTRSTNCDRAATPVRSEKRLHSNTSAV